MIWPFRPHAPLPLALKVSCERRVAAVLQILNLSEVPSHAVLTPEDIDRLIASCETANLPQRIFDFLAQRMPIPDTSINVVWGDESAMTDFAQMKEADFQLDENDKVIGISVHPLFAEFPYRATSVIAAAMSDFILMMAQKITMEFGLNETIPLLYGLGPIMANAALVDVSQQEPGAWQSFMMHRTGSVSAVEHGYTMALCDWVVGTDYHVVSKSLRLDAKEGLEKGLRFLKKTGDACISLESPGQTRTDELTVVNERLRFGTDTMKLNTLIELHDSESLDNSLAESVSDLLRHDNVEIQKIAAAVLNLCASIPRDVHDELVGMLRHGSTQVRQSAVYSIRPGYENDVQNQEAVVEMLRRGEASSAAICIQTLLKFKSLPNYLPDVLLPKLSVMVSIASTEEIAMGVDLLQRATDNVHDVLNDYFVDDPTARAVLTEAVSLLNDTEAETLNSAE